MLVSLDGLVRHMLNELASLCLNPFDCALFELLHIKKFLFYNYVHVGRILSSTRDKQVCGDDNNMLLKGDSHKENQFKAAHLSQFLPTSRRIVQFSNGKVCLNFHNCNMVFTSNISSFFMYNLKY